jgi:hypothetical protein
LEVVEMTTTTTGRTPAGRPRATAEPQLAQIRAAVSAEVAAAVLPVLREILRGQLAPTIARLDAVIAAREGSVR